MIFWRFAMKSPSAKKIRSEAIPAPLINNPTPEVMMNEMIETLVRERAYQIYMERNGQNGHAEADWYAAEAEILQRLNSAAA
jgi:hypothetical protein